MTRRAGIFDPWRQGAVEPTFDESPARKTVTEYPANDAPVPQHQIQFNGIRAGIYVWMDDGGEDDSLKARQILSDLIYKLKANPEIAPILRSWGVYAEERPAPNNVVVGGSGQKFTISIPPDQSEDRLVPRAVDNLSLALREASSRRKEILDLLVALKVRPYIK